jgi:hypothetical protein
MIKQTQHGDYEKVFINPQFAKYRVQVVFCEDLKEAWQARHSSKLKIGEDCKAFHHTNDAGTSSLYFVLGNCTTGCIAHECLHAVIALMTYVDIGFKEEEFLTYMLDYFVQFVQDFKNDLIDQKVGIKSRKKKRES